MIQLRLLGAALLITLSQKSAAAPCPLSPTEGSSSFACHSDAPEKLSCPVHPTEALTRVSCNSDIALYLDNDMLASANGMNRTWVSPFATDVWQYMKKTYGGCADVKPPTTDKIGTCERFGDPKPMLFVAHKGKYGGGTVRSRFDEVSQYRNFVDIAYTGWNESDDELRDVIVHEFCHHVEGSSRGTHESPAFDIWGDSMWAQYCIFDYYTTTGNTRLAERALTRWTPSTFDRPQGAVKATWFKDWFHPLWTDFKGPQAMVNFFTLLADNFPVRKTSDGYNTYTRRMTIGEFVHFTSAAAGKDLRDRAKTAFNSGWKPEQFDQARKDFSALNNKYKTL
ncbi:hypothetical protein DFS34DRAFT_412846 [Phlyctochytrium arcticum]|nr:hypothetical protein DFS34DRAFT_412846 [Phlyctochytrium arcticum]